jgi:putative transposase
MRQSRSTEDQILFGLTQAEAGQRVGDVCRQIGVSEATFYLFEGYYAYINP